MKSKYAENIVGVQTMCIWDGYSNEDMKCDSRHIEVIGEHLREPNGGC